MFYTKQKSIINGTLIKLFSVKTYTNSASRILGWTISAVFLICLLFSAFSAQIKADTTTKYPRLEIVPPEGVVGTNVFIRVWDFEAEKTILFKFTANTTYTYSATTDLIGFAVLNMKIDQIPGGRYTVSADDGTTQKTGIFKVNPQAIISQIGGSVGDIVSVRGNGFAASKPISVYFDDVKITTSDADNTGAFSNARFSIPPTPFGKHTIKTQDSEGTFSSSIYIVNQKTSINPITAQVNDSLAITGTGFPVMTNLVIYFDDKENITTQTDKFGAFNATVKVPPCSDGAHKIKTSDGLNLAFNDITVLSSIAISKDSGFINMQVTISGTGFRSGNSLNAMYDSIKLNGTSVDGQGNFTLAVNIPKSRAGAHTITVNDGVNTKKVTFTVESTPPPVPNLLLPAEGSRMTKDVKFQWDMVTDPSGVAYTIQISDDARFAKPILTEANMLLANYSIPEEKKILISRGEPYFWRIKAVDNASNESNWSVTGSFYKGYTMNTIISDMPFWTKFALIALGVVLFVFLVLFIWKNLKRVTAMRYEEQEPEYYGDSEYETNWEETKVK